MIFIVDNSLPYLILVVQPPLVRYGPTKELAMKENAYLTHTYTKDDMCQAPANDTGFWHPGMVYDVLLKNLQPNTMYYYSYGTDEVSENNNYLLIGKKSDSFFWKENYFCQKPVYSMIGIVARRATDAKSRCILQRSTPTFIRATN